MKVELTTLERDLLEGLLEAAYKGRLHELHHTASNAFKQKIRRELVTLEGLQSKLASPEEAVLRR